MLSNVNEAVISEIDTAQGKANTQQMERKHLTLRTGIQRTPLAERSSIARRTICFSKSETVHDVVIELYIDRYEFGLLV